VANSKRARARQREREREKFWQKRITDIKEITIKKNEELRLEKKFDSIFFTFLKSSK